MQPTISVPIGVADRHETGFVFVKDARELASMVISLVWEKKLLAPAVVLLTEDHVFSVSAAQFSNDGLPAYQKYFTRMVEEKKPFAVIQALYAAVEDGDQPFLHVRAEKLSSDEAFPYDEYGVLISGWGLSESGSLNVQAIADKSLDVPRVRFLAPLDGSNGIVADG